MMDYDAAMDGAATEGGYSRDKTILHTLVARVTQNHPDQPSTSLLVSHRRHLPSL